MSLHRFSAKVILLTVTPPAAAARDTKSVIIWRRGFALHGEWNDEKMTHVVVIFSYSQEWRSSLFSVQPLLCSAADFSAELSWGDQMTDRRWPFWCTPPSRGLVVLTILSELSVQPASQAAVGKKFPQHLSADWWSGSSLAWPPLQ